MQDSWGIHLPSTAKSDAVIMQPVARFGKLACQVHRDYFLMTASQSQLVANGAHALITSLRLPIISRCVSDAAFAYASTNIPSGLSTGNRICSEVF
jgi:hypothetical protein